jgi:hypothetical protein
MMETMLEAPLFDATIRYGAAGERAIFYPTDRARSHWPTAEHQVPMHDMRPLKDELSFDRNGFVLLERPSAMVDFYDPGEVERVYVPEIKALVRELTGAEQVITFGVMTRSDAQKTGDGSLPSFGAHIDYGDRTVRQFSEDILGKAEADRLLRRRHMLINLWRPIVPVERSPLALVDASTVAEADLNESEIRGGLGDPNRPPMYGFNLSYNPEHRWYYAPRMRPEEILAFKLYDSDTERTQWTGHTAFADPSAGPDARPRESIEIRTVSFMPE